MIGPSSKVVCVDDTKWPGMAYRNNPTGCPIINGIYCVEDVRPGRFDCNCQHTFLYLVGFVGGWNIKAFREIETTTVTTHVEQEQTQ